jgi:hypothetical protein
MSAMSGHLKRHCRDGQERTEVPAWRLLDAFRYVALSDQAFDPLRAVAIITDLVPRSRTEAFPPSPGMRRRKTHASPLATARELTSNSCLAGRA